MMAFSRRQLAKYGADQLLSGKSVKLVAKDLAAGLLLSKREKEADLLVQDIAWELEHRGKLAIANVTSAHALSSSLRSEIIKQLNKALEADQVVLEENVDKSVIGGVRVETADHIWDKTVAAELAQLKEAF